MSDSKKPEQDRPDDDLGDEELDQASGGRSQIPDVAKTPTPGGPVPIPYPNVVGPAKNA